MGAAVPWFCFVTRNASSPGNSYEHDGQANAELMACSPQDTLLGPYARVSRVSPDGGLGSDKIG